MQSNQVKKGTNPASKSRFKPGSTLGYLNVPEGYKGRWCDSDEVKTQKKMQEGWQFVNKTNFPSAVHEKKHGNVRDVKDGSEKEGGPIRYRELVGMMLPVQDVNGDGLCVEERQKFYQEQTDAELKSRVRAEKNKSTILGSEFAQQANITSRLVIE